MIIGDPQACHSGIIKDRICHFTGWQLRLFDTKITICSDQIRIMTSYIKSIPALEE